jgi:hypothetical protein
MLDFLQYPLEIRPHLEPRKLLAIFGKILSVMIEIGDEGGGATTGGGVGGVCLVGSSDFDIFKEIQYASCVFGLALKS